MSTLPGWLTHRARTAGFTWAHTLLAPRTPTSHAIYLLERGTDDVARTRYELHVVEDASSGIDGETTALSEREGYAMLAALGRVVVGRAHGEEILPLKVEEPAAPEPVQ